MNNYDPNHVISESAGIEATMSFFRSQLRSNPERVGSKKTLEDKMKKSLGLLLIVFVFAVSQINAAWWSNDTYPCPGCAKITISGAIGSSDDVIVDGASAFLQSYANILLLLNESELSSKYGFNFSSSGAIVDLALTKLSEAKKNHLGYLQCLEQITISKDYIDALIGFDYKALVEKRNLDPYVMGKVTVFLKKGDIKGFFYDSVNRMEELRIILLAIDGNIKNSIIPDMETLRSLYQKYSELMTMGYYSSLVFLGVK